MTNDEITLPITKSQSKKFAPNCKIHEVETFLSRIEQGIFSNTLNSRKTSTE